MIIIKVAQPKTVFLFIPMILFFLVFEEDKCREKGWIFKLFFEFILNWT